MTKVKLTYFKDSGKYYSSDEFVALDPLKPWELRAVLEGLENLPGLVSTFREWTFRSGGFILAESEDWAPMLLRAH